MLQRLILVTVLIAFIAPAQVPYGRMTGRVIDSAGAVVPAAAVRVKNLDTNLVTSASSDSQGNYEVRNLIPGVIASAWNSRASSATNVARWKCAWATC
jgi:hypothetical protein